MPAPKPAAVLEETSTIIKRWVPRARPYKSECGACGWVGSDEEIQSVDLPAGGWQAKCPRCGVHDQWQFHNPWEKQQIPEDFNLLPKGSSVRIKAEFRDEWGEGSGAVVGYNKAKNHYRIKFDTRKIPETIPVLVVEASDARAW